MMHTPHPPVPPSPVGERGGRVNHSPRPQSGFMKTRLLLGHHEPPSSMSATADTPNADPVRNPLHQRGASRAPAALLRGTRLAKPPANEGRRYFYIGHSHRRRPCYPLGASSAPLGADLMQETAEYLLSGLVCAACLTDRGRRREEN